MAHLRNSPLLATKRDQALFVDREQTLRHLLDSVAAGLNTVLVGSHGVGKTSVLQRFLAQIEEAGDHVASRRWLPIMVTGEPASAPAFLATLLDRLVDAMRREGVPFDVNRVPTTLRIVGPAELESAAGGMLARLRAIGELAGQLRDQGMIPVFLVDELAHPDVAITIFGRMRDEMWQLGGTWIVTSDGAERDALLQPPADVFFERTIELGPLSPEAARALLRARLDPAEATAFDDETLDRVLRLSRGLPRALVTLARAVLAGDSLDETEAQVQRLSSQIADLGQPAQRLASMLHQRGGTGRATDPDLQWSMGWSASRLRQVFQELDRAGVVEHVPARPGRPGRPSKTYRLRSPL